MQVFGKIGALRQVPFYLGFPPKGEYHITVLCDETGAVYDAARLADARITHEEITEFLSEQLPVVARLLKKPINKVHVRAPVGQIPHIVDYK